MYVRILYRFRHKTENQMSVGAAFVQTSSKQIWPRKKRHQKVKVLKILVMFCYMNF